MKNINKNIFLSLAFLSFLVPISNAQSYEDWLKHLATISRDTVEKIEKLAKDTSFQLQQTSEFTQYGMAGFDRGSGGAFDKAVNEAEKFGADKVSNKLTAITPQNPNLIWNPAKTHVLMVSWMPDWAADSYYRPKLGQDFSVNYKEMWVSAVPEVKNFLKNYSGRASAHYRLQQLLGLPAAKAKNYFVEIWVRPQDMVRPCIDPEITDNKCESDSNPPPATDPKHVSWYNAEKAGKYHGQWTFPWTRFGYSYDLGKTGPDKFGVSEFVVKLGSTVKVHRIIPTDQYKSSSPQ